MLQLHRFRDPAMHVCEGVGIERLPFEDMTVLEERQPLRITETVVGMVQAGYETKTKGLWLTEAVLRRWDKWFVEREGDWA